MASTRLRRWVRNAAVALIVAAFVLVFGQPRGYSGTGAVAEVNGELIRRDVFEFFRDLNTARSSFPSKQLSYLRTDRSPIPSGGCSSPLTNS